MVLDLVKLGEFNFEPSAVQAKCECPISSWTTWSLQDTVKGRLVPQDLEETLWVGQESGPSL